MKFQYLLCMVFFVSLLFRETSMATELVEVDYMLNCQGCHLPDGSGFPQRQVPSLKAHMSKFLHVKGGREFLVQVPGSATSDLNDARLTNLLNWMLVRFDPQNIPEGFKPYSVDEVSELRKEPLVKVTENRNKLMTLITQAGLIEGRVQVTGENIVPRITERKNENKE